MTRTFIQIVSLIGCLAAAGSLLATPPIFLARRDYATSGGSIALAVADANGDRIPDIIWVGGPGLQEITTLFGSGKGTFRQGPSSQEGSIVMNHALPVATDLNGDGKIDIITSGSDPTGSGILVCLGNGDGTFQPAVLYTTATPNFLGNVILADFNRDGIPDAVVAGQSEVWLFPGTGNGSFNPATPTPVPNSYAGQIVAADFNGDGDLDVAVVTSTGFAVLFGNGDGTFQTPQAYTVPGAAWIAADDLNLDHHPDIVLAAYPQDPPIPNYVRVYLNNGRGGFSKPTPAELSPVEQIAIADVNGDGIPDLIGSNGGVAQGRSDGTFRPPTYYPLPAAYTITFVVAADLLHNGREDLVFEDSGGTISVLLNFGKGRLEDGEWIPVAGGAGCAAAADYNGDSKPDVAVNTANGISVLLGTGEAFPAFKRGASIPLSSAGCVVTGDLNNDGIPDLLVPSNGTVVAYLGNGDGTFTQASVTSTPTYGFLALGDFNHDGKLDFATSGNLLAYGNGDGTFQAPIPIINSPPPYGGYTNLAAGDLNGDGWPDLVITSEYDRYVYVLLNDQHGGFTVSSFQPSINAGQVLLTDLDGDNALDMVLVDFSGASADIYLGNGKGGFTYKTGVAGFVNPLVGPSWAAVSDINGDGIPDVVLTADSTLKVFQGKGDGTFQNPPFYIGAGLAPDFLVLEDLHGQPTGFPDIVAPDVTGGVMVLINATNWIQ